MEIQVPSDENNYLTEHVKVLRKSYESLVGRVMYPGAGKGVAFAANVFNAPFALVSHSTEDNPVFNYANRVALALFEMTWQEFIQLPSKLSAEQPNREERTRLLASVDAKGYIENYSGIRVSKTGRRFMINQAVVWNLYDDHDQYYGQAALFSNWDYLG